MKMAKASKADIDMAFELSQFVEELVDGFCPKKACEKPESEEIEWLDDDLDQLKRVIDALTSIARKGSIFRVVGGMAVVCDPKNELLDPDADTLEVHPKFDRLHAANVELVDVLREIAKALPADKSTVKTCYAINDQHRDLVHAALAKNGATP